MTISILKARRVIGDYEWKFVTVIKLGRPYLDGKWWKLDVLRAADMSEVLGWQFENCEGRRPVDYHYAKQGKYVAFRKEEDAMLCYLRFSDQ